MSAGCFSSPLPNKFSPPPPYSNDTRWHVVFSLGKYKQRNTEMISKKWVDKSPVSAGIESSETLLGRG